MNQPKLFWLGVALCIGGIVLMSLPVKPCEDCDDETETTHIYSEAEDAPGIAESPSDD